MNKIFYLMGKSSAGKDSIFRILSQKLPDFKSLVTYTTRPMRCGEKDGKEYHFISNEELTKFQKEGKIIELRKYQTMQGVWSYCTVKDEQFDSPNHLLAIGTLESYKSLKNYFKDDRIYPIYIDEDDTTRLERAIAREKRQDVSKYEEMCRRFLADADDFSEEKLKEAGISPDTRFLNENLYECVIDVLSYIVGVLCNSVTERKGKKPHAKDIYRLRKISDEGNNIIYECPECGASLGLFMAPPKFCEWCQTEINWEGIQLKKDIPKDSDLDNITIILDEINKRQLE